MTNDAAIRRDEDENRAVADASIGGGTARRMRVEAKQPSLRRRLILADIGALMVGVASAFAVQAVAKPVPLVVASNHVLLVIASLPGFAIGAGFNRLYLARANERRLEEASNVLKAIGVGVSWMLIISFAVQYGELSRLWVATTAVSTTVAILIERRIARSMFRRLRQQGRLRRRIIIVGTDTHALNLLRTYERDPALGYEVVGFAGAGEADALDGNEILGTIDELSDLLERHDAVGVVVSLASVASEDVNLLTRRLTDDGFHVALSSSLPRHRRHPTPTPVTRRPHHDLRRARRPQRMACRGETMLRSVPRSHRDGVDAANPDRRRPRHCLFLTRPRVLSSNPSW